MQIMNHSSAKQYTNKQGEKNVISQDMTITTIKENVRYEENNNIVEAENELNTQPHKKQQQQKQDQTCTFGDCSRTFLMVDQEMSSNGIIVDDEEPKGHNDVDSLKNLANDRKYIRSASAVLFLLFIGSFILEFGTSIETISNSTNVAARIILILLGGIIIAYSMVVYYRRRKRLQFLVKTQPYDDGYTTTRRVGPSLFLGGVVFSSMIIVFIHLWSLLWPSVLVYKSEQCFRHPLIVNPINLEASDLSLDSKHDVLLFPSGSTISALHKSSTKIGEGVTNALASSALGEGDADFKAITSGADGRIFALRGHNKNNNESSDNFLELLELKWNDDGGGGNDDDVILNFVQSWEINDSEGVVGGITWVPDDGDGLLFIAIDYDSDVNTDDDDKSNRGDIHTYEMPNGSTLELKRLRSSLNRKVMNSGLEDSKIGSLQYFEGLLYVLHDNARAVRVWDISSGDLKSEWELPRVHGGYNEQWEGLFLERTDNNNSSNSDRRLLQQQQQPPKNNDVAWQYQQNNWQGEMTVGLSELTDLISEDDEITNYLRGIDDDNVDTDYYPSKSSLILHLALNMPVEIWSIAVTQDAKTGRIILPSCASPRSH